jgi:hypothetical protein
MTEGSASLDDSLQLLGESLNRIAPEALPYLGRAIRCAGVVEMEKRQFPKHSAGFELLGGLQRKLLMDDYAYAALVTGKLDRTQAGEVCTHLVQRLQQLQDAEMKRYGFGN